MDGRGYQGHAMLDTAKSLIQKYNANKTTAAGAHRGPPAAESQRVRDARLRPRDFHG